MKRICFILCILSLSCLIFGVPETAMEMEPEESWRNSTQCSVNENNGSCRRMCNGYEINECRHTLPTKQKFQCKCKNKKPQPAVIKGKERTLDKAVVPCPISMKNRCKKFCGDTQRTFSKCVQDRKNQPLITLCRCRRQG